MSLRFYCGLDVGQAQDYTALVIMEREPDIAPASYHLRFLQRFPLRMPYPAIIESVQTVVSQPPLPSNTVLLVDATGVGRPVVDMLKQAKLPVKLVPITITGGSIVVRDRGHFHVPKRDLASATKILLDSQRLKVSTALPQYALLVKELEAFRVKINVKTAHDSYEAWREGDHDDLVLSVAMCAWYAERGYKRMFEDETDPEAAQETARQQQENPNGYVEIRKLNETYDEIIVHPPKVEPQQGWTWNDLKRGMR